MIHSGRALAAAGLLVVCCAAAGARADDTTARAPDGANIVNGIPTNLQPTTGALLFVGPDLKNQFLDCSGVLIGCRTVLTAAHCICKNSANYADCVNNELPNLDVADLRFFFQHTGFHHIRDIYIDPTYVAGTGGDIAMLRLSELVTGVEPTPFHNGFPNNLPHETPGVIAGFGNSGDGRLDAAIKRVGSISTTDCPVDTGIYEPANICWNFTAPIAKPGDESNLCLMDDGGPLFVDFGNGPEVAGIDTGSGNTCDVNSFSYATNVAHSRDWIGTVGGPDVQRDQCSDLGEVGAPWVKVQGGSGTLPKDQDEARFSFEIPDDTLLLRVTVNGDTEKDGDYDMFVGLGQKLPTRFDYDCQQRGVGQFGACEFQETDLIDHFVHTTSVNVLIRHVRPNIGRGKSRFQVTVTAFEPVPPTDDAPRGPDMLRYTKRATDLRTLTWIDDSDNETGFELQRRPGTDPAALFSTRAVINRANRESYLESIRDDQVFTYRIRAFNAFGSSEWSNLCVVNLPRLPRPTRLHTVSMTPTTVTLRWRDNSEGESYMELQRRPLGATKWRTIKTLPADTRDYIDHGVDPGQSYEYHVRARGYLDECIKHSAFSPILEVTTPLQ